MNSRNGSSPVVLYLVIFVAGMSFSLLGSMLPDICDQLGLSRSRASSLPLFQFSGDFAGLLLLGLWLKRPGALLVSSALALGAAAVGIALAPSFTPALKAAFFVFGAASGILITLPGMIAARMAAGSSARAMNLVYAFFSAGVMLAPLGSGALVQAGLHYRAAFLGLAVAAVGSGAAALIMRFEYPDLGEGLRLGPLSELIRGHGRIVAVVILMNLFYVASEAVPNAWIPKYLDDAFPGHPGFRSAAVLSLFWGAITAGRFICAWLIGKGAAPRALLAALAGLASLCLAAAPAVHARLGAEVLFVASGLFFSGMFPIIISHTDRAPERLSGALFILVMAAGMLGASGAGKAVGVVADTVSFPWGMAIAAALSGLVLLLVPLLGRRPADSS